MLTHACVMPALLQQVLASVSGLASISTDPTPDTQQQLQAIGAQALAAFTLAGQGTDSATASNLLQVLSGARPAAAQLAASLQQVAALLAKTATPASGAVSAGGMGLYVTVGNLVGRSLAGQVLAVGPYMTLSSGSTAAAPSSSRNVLGVFSGALEGSCSSLAADGSTQVAPCPDAVVAVQLRLVEAVRELLGSAAAAAAPAGGNTTAPSGARRLQATPINADDITPLSGAVNVTVGDTAALPCAGSTNCTLTLSFPLLTDVAVGDPGVVCLQLVGDTLLVPDATDGWSLGAVTPAADNPAVKVAQCVVSQSGTYVIARNNSVPAPPLAASTSPIPAGGMPVSSPGPAQGVGEAPAPVLASPSTSLVLLALTFPLDYATLMADSSQAQAFNDSIVASVAAAAQVSPAWVQVLALRQGSVVAEVAIRLPGSNYSTPQQLAAVGAAITQDPDTVFASLKATFGITQTVGARVTSMQAATPPGPSYSAVGLGVGLGVGLAVLLAVVGYALVTRRRRGVQLTNLADVGRQPVAAPAPTTATGVRGQAHLVGEGQ
jgi:hypothetical protein